MDDNWIDINEELPTRGKPVLVYARDGIFVGAKSGKKSYVCFDLYQDIFPIRPGISEVTHWMPLPKPPKKPKLKKEE